MGQDFIDPIAEFEQSVCIEFPEFFRFHILFFHIPSHVHLRIADPQDALRKKLCMQGHKPIPKPACQTLATITLFPQPKVRSD